MARATIRDGLSVDQLKAALDYYPDCGLFFWRHRPDQSTRTNSRTAGKLAGHRCPRLGYVLLGLNGRLYRAHRLVWLYVHGRWPDGDIDHINGDGFDNRISNLRDASRTQNNGNMRRPKHNSSGLKGAFYEKRSGRWLAQIRHEGQQHYLGKYDTAAEAHAAYCEAAARLHGAFARTE
jgi:hypothetical protein